MCPSLRVYGSKAARVLRGGGELIATPKISGGCDLGQSALVDGERQEAEMTEFFYFAQHSLAMDTVAGIVEWWMPDKIRPDQEAMRKVLDRLTERGIPEIPPSVQQVVNLSAFACGGGNSETDILLL